MRRLLMIWALLLCSGMASATDAPAQNTSPMKIYTSDQRYEDVVENVKMAIIDRGLLVSGTLHVSDMLNRTAPDLGFSEVFVKAESVEFCSALISHKMAQAAPQNVTICPFTIAVYVTTSEPDKVHLAYRLPLLEGDDGQVTAAVVEMLDGIVQDSL
ncbi:MAG: hypothetical protein P8178_11075 [Candidatus Thiodiazotropha sp.]